MVKGPKDPNAPKKALTPYMVFSSKNRERIVKTLPEGHSFGDVGKAISVEGAKESEKEKAKMDKTFKASQAQYQKKLEAYKKTSKYKKFQELKQDFKDKEAKKASKFPKDENAPKRPQSAYFCFMGDKREDVKKSLGDDIEAKEVMKKLGEMWGKLSDNKKKPYEKEADKEKAKYEKALEKYKKSNNYKKYQKAKEEH